MKVLLLKLGIMLEIKRSDEKVQQKEDWANDALAVLEDQVTLWKHKYDALDTSFKTEVKKYLNNDEYNQEIISLKQQVANILIHTHRTNTSRSWSRPRRSRCRSSRRR